MFVTTTCKMTKGDKINKESKFGPLPLPPPLPLAGSQEMKVHWKIGLKKETKL